MESNSMARRDEEGMASLKFLIKLFNVFFKIGAFTFGGGFAMIPLIEREVVEANGWVDPEEFVDIVSLTQSAPGAVAINTAVFIGYKLAGFAGAIASTGGTVLPPFMIILLIAISFARFKEVEMVEMVFSGIRPAIVALVLVAARSIGKKVLVDLRYGGMALLALIILIFLDIHPVLLILASGVIGALFFRPSPVGKGK